MLLFVQASKRGSPYKKSCEIVGLATVVFSLCVMGGARSLWRRNLVNQKCRLWQWPGSLRCSVLMQ